MLHTILQDEVLQVNTVAGLTMHYPMLESFQDYSWNQDFEADFP